MKKLIKFLMLSCCLTIYPIQHINAANNLTVLPYAYFSTVSAIGKFGFDGINEFEFNGTFKINVNENTGYINSVELYNYTTDYSSKNIIYAKIISSSDLSSFIKRIRIQITEINSKGAIIKQDTFNIDIKSTGPRLV